MLRGGGARKGTVIPLHAIIPRQSSITGHLGRGSGANSFKHSHLNFPCHWLIGKTIHPADNALNVAASFLRS